MSFRRRNERNSPENVKRRSNQSPTPGVKDPSLPMTKPSSSKDRGQIHVEREEEIPFKKRLKTYLYNKEENTYCGRTCKSWLFITLYAIMYFIFLCTYTLIFLYVGLWILRFTTDFSSPERPDALVYSKHGVGLSATPTGITSYPIVTYRLSKAEDYEKYVNALDNLLDKRRKNATLGPCGERPYGYGQSPCIVIRINKQYRWAGKPLLQNSTESIFAPKEVQSWLKRDKKLWLHCSGYHSYDKEHIGRIRYFPDPPGFDPNVFPLKHEDSSPLVAIQISNYTLGVSLAVECKLWYVNGPASTEFLLHIESDDHKRLILDRT